MWGLYLWGGDISRRRGLYSPSIKCPSFSFFRSQVFSGTRAGSCLTGDALFDSHPGGFESLQLRGIVRKKPDCGQAEVAHDGDRQFIAALVRFETQFLVGFDRVCAFILKLVSHQLVDKTDATSFLRVVDQQPAAFFGDPFNCHGKLRSTIAARAAKDVTR